MKKQITANRRDELGMQVYCRLYAKAYSNYIGAEYIHTPFTRPDILGLENFFNLGHQEKKITDNRSATDIGNTIRPLTVARNNPDLPALNFTQEFINELLQKYYLTPKKNSKEFAASEGLKVAIHVRKCNTKNSMGRLRNTPTSFIAAVFRKLNELYSHEKISVHIYSNQILHINFSNKLYQRSNLTIFPHYQRDIKQSIHDMICSDILFKYGASSFGGICTLYNQQTSVFSFAPGKDYFINAYQSPGCYFLNPPIKFPPLKSLTNNK